MSSNVTANGLAIVCKGPDAKSICAFPDVCNGPPGPPVGPIPTPFPNTALASDMGPGSKDVTAGGKPIMLKDVSFIEKSSGDEAATSSFGGGLMTAKIQGKAYPQSFSPNVQVEGKNVVRSLDLMTHNHAGAMPGNTPPWPIVVTG